MNPHDFRADFPILQTKVASGAPLVYLDNAASTQHPQAVLDAMNGCYLKYYANVHRGVHALSESCTEAYERARQVVCSFLNSPSPRQIIFTGGCTAAMNLVARSWGESQLGPNDVVLLTMMEHHANIVPWHQLASRVGCRVAFVPITEDGQLDLKEVQQYLDTLRPKIFAFTAVSNVLGTINPVRELCELAKNVNAVSCVDAAQAAPHLSIDVQVWDADFVVFSGHKLCGPTGIGVLYGRESLLEAMPPFLGGGAMISKVTTEGFSPASIPEKFEAGTPPIAEAIGLAAAVEYISSIGLNAIHEHEQRLVTEAMRQLAEIPGLQMFGPPTNKRGGLVSFVLEGVHAHDIAQGLDQRGVAVRAGHHCTMPLHKFLGIAATARASFYLYNTLEEVSVLTDALRGVRDRFAPRGRRRK